MIVPTDSNPASHGGIMFAHLPRSEASILIFPLDKGQIKILNGDFRLDVVTTPSTHQGQRAHFVVNR
jgi:hypothetical protein